jgi:hypothetical protein
MRKNKGYIGFAYPLLRFTAGGLIGFVGVAVFTTNPYIAVVVAVGCGVFVDKIFTKK